MFEDFDFAILDDPEFKEDSVREELIQPILQGLGYSATGQHRIIRSKAIAHPHVMIGSKSRKINITPDYLMKADSDYGFVLDAKGPTEAIYKSENVEQVFSYAIHPDVRVWLYALCNGREFAVYNVSEPEPVLRFPLTEIESNWEKLQNLLSPDAILKARKKPLSDIEIMVSAGLRWVEEKKFEAARTVVEEIRRHQDFAASQTIIQAKVATINAQTALAFGDDEIAIEEFELALILAPQEMRYISNASFGAMMKGDFDQAIILAKQLQGANPKDENAAMVLVQTWHRQGKPELIEEFLSKSLWFYDSPNCLAALALVRNLQDRYTETIELATKALKKDRSQLEALQALCDSLFHPIREKVRNDSLLHMDVITRRDIWRAEAAINRAVKIVSSTPNRTQLHQLLLQRSAIRSSRGRVTEAVNDCDVVLSNNPKPPERDLALLNKGMFLLSASRYSEAVSCFEKIQDENRMKEATSPLAYCYHTTEIGRLDEAAEIFESLWQPKTCSKEHIQIAEILISIHRRRYEPEQAAKVLAQLKENCLGHPETVALLAEEKWDEGEKEEALKLLQDAISKNEGIPRSLLQIRMGQMFYYENRFEEAANAWQEAGPENLLPIHHQTFIHALYHSGQLETALKEARKSRLQGGFNSRAAEVEAAICSYIGERKEALELLSEINRREPNNYQNLLNQVLLLMQDDKFEDARAHIKRLPYYLVRNDAKELRRAAELMSNLEMPEALKYAFRGRQIDFGNPESHRLYTRVFIHVTQVFSKNEEGDVDDLRAADTLNLNGPSPGSVPCSLRFLPVDSDNQDEQRAFTILKEEPFDQIHGFYSPQSDFAKRLLVMKHGDVISLKQEKGNKREYRLTEIIHPYVHAFQESGTQSSKWFPENSALKSLDIRDGLEPFWAMVDAAQRGFDEVIKWYADWRIPLCTVGEIRSKSVFDLWLQTSARLKWGIHASRGSNQDFDEGLARLSKIEMKTQVVLDFTSLMALVYLGFAETIKPHFDLMVPESLHREIKGLLYETQNDKSRMTVGKEGDRYVVEETTDQMRENRSNVLQKLLDFCELETSVLPAKAIIKFPQSQIQEWERHFGQSSLDVMLLAFEYKALVYTDDALLREVFKDICGVRGTTTQWILHHLYQSSRLDKQDYYEALEKLSVGNFKMLHLNTDFFIWLLNKHHYTANPSVRAAFRFLEGPSCDEDAAINIISAIINEPLSANLNNIQMTSVLDLCLFSLTTGRLVNDVIRKLKGSLLRLAIGNAQKQLAYQRLCAYIEVWRRGINP